MLSLILRGAGRFGMAVGVVVVGLVAYDGVKVAGHKVHGMVSRIRERRAARKAR